MPNIASFYQYNKQLKLYNSFRTEALAKIFCEPQNEEELHKCINEHNESRILILGDGCNLFFTKNFEGLVIKPNLFGIKEIKETENHIYVESMASENWDKFVEYCVNKGHSGLENLSLIPGTVGASPVQNIGAYGSEVKDHIETVTAIDLDTKNIVKFSNKACKFGYRDSIFKQTKNHIIISVLFKLNKSYSYTPKYADLNRSLEHISKPSLKEVRNAVIKIRESKLPDEKILPNAGSFFKNPYISLEKSEILKNSYTELPLYPINDELVKTSAAFLIDKAGFKGKRIGNIGTYEKQALIIVNYGAIDGNEIISFMKKIQESVFDQFEIKLEPEVGIF